ncbi:MAG: nucleotide exchange factor GrpE [Pseudomonadota bacterium]
MFLDDPETLEEIELEDEPTLEAIELDAITAERDELKDRLLRALAETENLRKRADRDRRDAELYGGVRLARDLLSVHDNLGRALEAIDDELRGQAGAVVEGIELTQRELLAAFNKHKIQKIEPVVGDKFDPKLHQAMFEAPVPDQPAGHIIQVMATGFEIGERLLRPAQVGVSAGGVAIPPEDA